MIKGGMEPWKRGLQSADRPSGIVSCLQFPLEIETGSGGIIPPEGVSSGMERSNGVLGAVLGYEFSNEDLLEQALSHASGTEHRLHSNERLEFLGDAILGMVVCDYVYRTSPASSRGR